MAPKSVTLNKTTLSLAVGANETLTATVLPVDADDKTVTFASSEPTIATVTPK
ncbi:Ig domain-containing protein, partial [Lactococcus lactis]